MLHKMHLHSGPFEKISDGRKVIEVRLLDEKRKRISVDDEIEFTNRENPQKILRKKVIALYIAPTFSDLFDALSASDFGPKDKEDFLSIKRFYTDEDEKKYGVVGIRLG